MERNLSTKKAEWVALTGILISFVFCLLVFLIGWWSKAQSLIIEACHLASGSFIWFVVFLHLRQKRLALEESVHIKNTGEKENSSLFTDEQDPFSATSRLQFFEKWIIPIFTSVFGGVLLIGGVYLFCELIDEGPKTIQNAPLTSAFMAGFAFFSLLLSKYALGMAKEKNWRRLKAGGSYLFTNAVLCFLCSIFIAITTIEFFKPQYYLAMVISVLISIIGFEMLLNLLLDVYRPRVSGKEIHPPYDSRFLELCSGSKGLLITAAQTLDYQFGFKVSETWFYRFLEKAIAPLILFQLLSIYFLNCIVIVQPQNNAIVERFGKPIESGVLKPGIHFKWPWPVETVKHYPIYKVHTITLGHDGHEKYDDHKGHSHGHSHGPKKELPRKEAILFTQEHHGKEELFMTSHKKEKHKKKKTSKEKKEERSPINLVSMHFVIQYRIDAEHFYDYVYNYTNPEALLRGIAYREIATLFVATPFSDILGKERISISLKLQKHIQEECNRKKLGVKILLASIQNIHPPVPVADSFEGVISAMEEKETKILEAKKYKNKILPLANSEKKKILTEAKTYKYRVIKFSEAEKELFDNLLKAYRAGGKIYLNRKYLKVLEKLKGKRIIINLTKSKVTVITNIEDKYRSDLFDLEYNKEEQKK